MSAQLRRCTTCGREKPSTEFPKDPTHRRCKQCKSAGAKRSYERHKPAAIARAKSWRDRNYLRAKALRRAWQKKNMPRIGAARAAAGRERYYANLEKYRAYFREKERQKRIADPTYVKRRYADNREKLQAASREWSRRHPDAQKLRRQANPEPYRKRAREDARKRRAQKRATVVEKIDYDKIIDRDQMRCHICRRKVKPAELHFDHVIPLAKGGEHTQGNIAVSHARCNMSKGAKLLTLF